MSEQSPRRERLPGDVRWFRSFDGARLAYEVAGSGPPLVMLHGLLAGRLTFSRQREAMAAHRRVLLLSARGHDGSDASLPSNYGVGSSDVDDLDGLLDAERITCADLVGHSSGGATVFMFARRHPRRVRRLVLIEPTLFGLLPPAEREAVVAPSMAVAATALADGPQAAVRAALDFTGGEAWHRLDADTQVRRLQAMAPIAAVVGPHMRGLCELAVTEDDVRALDVPTLLLYGENSFRFEAEIARRWRVLRPELRVLTLAGAGHNVHRERADVVNAEIAAFLAG